MPMLDSYILRPLQLEDLPLILTWRNSDRIRANMYNDHLITMEEHRHWFDTLDPNRSTYLVLECDGKPVGMSYFTSIDQIQNRAEWGFYLGEETVPRGSGTIMGYLSLEHGFEHQQLAQIYGEVLAFNRSSRKFFERLGFDSMGVKSEPFMREEKQIDVYLFSMRSDKWKNEHHDRVRTMIERFTVEVG